MSLIKSRGQWHSEEGCKDEEHMKGLGSIKRWGNCKADKCRRKWEDVKRIDRREEMWKRGGGYVTKWCKRQRPLLLFPVASNKMLQSDLWCVHSCMRTHTYKGQLDFLIDWTVPCSDVSAGLKMNELTYGGKGKRREGKTNLCFLNLRGLCHMGYRKERYSVYTNNCGYLLSLAL